MMNHVTTVVNGKEIAARIEGEAREDISALKGRKIVILNDRGFEASKFYARSQTRILERNSINSSLLPYDPSWKNDDFLKAIDGLNADTSVAGISVHLPLPEGVDRLKVLNAISPKKDVEGLCEATIGSLLDRIAFPVPSAAFAAFTVAKEHCSPLVGKEIVIVNHSSLIGKPLSLMFLAAKNEAPTITICHQFTRDLSDHTRNADVVVMGAGKPGLLKAPMVKQGAAVIDISINTSADGKLLGDSDFDGLKGRCSVITPVPGGVGPITLAIFLMNAIACAKK